MDKWLDVLHLASLLARYEGLVQQFVALLAQFKHTPAGGTVTVPKMVVDGEGERWEIAEHEAHRIS